MTHCIDTTEISVPVPAALGVCFERNGGFAERCPPKRFVQDDPGMGSAEIRRRGCVPAVRDSGGVLGPPRNSKPIDA